MIVPSPSSVHVVTWHSVGTTGAVGNLYDRFTQGYVVDFLHLHHWPVFNVADSCITVGAVMLAWGLKDEKAPVKP